MANFLRVLQRWYRGYAWVLSWLQHPLLLALRVWFGLSFMKAGGGKLDNLDNTVAYFEKLHIPFPHFNALLAGGTEYYGGMLLIVGFAARFVTIPLIVTMIVAYCTAHAKDITDIPSFIDAPPFEHLWTCLLVLIYGAGLFSVDGITKVLLRYCLPPPTVTPAVSPPH